MKRIARIFLLSIFVIAFIATTNPTAEMTSTTILTDPQGDVRKWDVDNSSVPVLIGDFYPSIDIKAAYLNDTDLVIEFYGIPVPENYLNIQFDNESDGQCSGLCGTMEFLLYSNNGEVYFNHLEGMHGYWDSNTLQWVPSEVPFPIVFVNHSVVFPNILIPFPGLLSAGIDIYSKAPEVNNATSYWRHTDSAYKPRSGIPGFTGFYLFLSVLSVFCLIILFRKQKLQTQSSN